MRLKILIITLILIAIPLEAFAIDIGYQTKENTFILNSNLKDEDVRYKVILKHKESGSEAIYNYLNKKIEIIPLFGDGIYVLSLLKNESETRYKYIDEVEFEITNTSDKDFINDGFLSKKNKTINAKILSESINNVHFKTLLINGFIDEDDFLANEVKNYSTEELLNKTMKYVTNYLYYDDDKIDRIEKSYTPELENILNDNASICYDYAYLFSSVSKGFGIPTKLIKGYSSWTPVYHAWNEVLVDGEWKIIDATLYDSYIDKGYKAELFLDERFYEKTSEH